MPLPTFPNFPASLTFLEDGKEMKEQRVLIFSASQGLEIRNEKYIFVWKTFAFFLNEGLFNLLHQFPLISTQWESFNEMYSNHPLRL